MAYSVLTHEAIVDVTWDKTLKPILKQKFPTATDEQLVDAHAYVYGGSLVPDMGYYPFGNKLFTELLHYVRTGDFVSSLLEEAQNLNEYAFALGVLSHYNADKFGHPLSTNKCVALEFPDDKQKFGSAVTYEEDPLAHTRTEFGFDVVQTARGNYASSTYHSFIDFKISRPVLERAFLRTYGLNLNDTYKDLSLSIETFRWIVKNLFPVITRAAWASKKKEIKKAYPTMTRRKFEYRMKRANYYHEFGNKHEEPGFFPSAFALVIRVVPKFGPLKDYKVKIPTPEAETYFIKSFDTVTAHYIASVKKANNGNLSFSNVDYDTGNDTWQGEYGLADKNYILLLLKLKENNFANVSPALKANILHFYSTCNTEIAARAGLEQWNKLTKALDDLRDTKVTSAN